MQRKHQWADNLGLEYLLSERQLDFAAGPIPLQAVIDDGIWNRGSNEFGACAKRVRDLNGRPIVLSPLNSNRSLRRQPLTQAYFFSFFLSLIPVSPSEKAKY